MIGGQIVLAAADLRPYVVVGIGGVIDVAGGTESTTVAGILVARPGQHTAKSGSARSGQVPPAVAAPGRSSPGQLQAGGVSALRVLPSVTRVVLSSLASQ